MERLLVFALLVIFVSICIYLSSDPRKDLDGPAGAVGQVESLGSPNSCDFPCDISALLADGPGPSIGALV